MKVPLAWLNLVHQKKRSLIAGVGVAFAVLLVFMQLGFYGAAGGTATLIYDELAFDVLLVSSRYLDINTAGTFPRERLYQARGVEGVEHAAPLYVTFRSWRSRAGTAHGLPRRIMILGCPLDETVFRSAGKAIHLRLERHRDELQQPGQVLGDTSSKKEFQPLASGIEVDVGRMRVTVAGLFTLGTGFGANGLLLASDATFFRIDPSYPLNQVSLGLVRLSDHADLNETARALRQVLPSDVQVLTRPQLVERERNLWLWGTSIGIVFFLGVVVAFIVGLVFVFQVIASDIGNRLHEFATLKAVGFRDSQLSRVVLRQAMLVALFGYFPGLAASFGLYWLASSVTGVAIVMDLARALQVLGLTLLMCCCSGLLAMRKLAAADPADLF